MRVSVAELCAGGGGQALGLEMAGFHHEAAAEIEPQFCETLRTNRPGWNIIQDDIRNLDPKIFSGVDLLAAGVPCPPFSIAGKQLGADDDRDMFPTAMEIVRKSRPRGVLFENVPGLASAKFSEYRKSLLEQLARCGYQAEWRVLNASDFGVPQLRPRFLLIALKPGDAECFRWPSSVDSKPTVGSTLVDLMAANGWPGASEWAVNADNIAPTIVGGSKKHGGPDLGPTRAKAQWRALGVDGMGIANAPPPADAPDSHLPRLTLSMVARIQGFPDHWVFSGRKTPAYRRVGNAFPPPMAQAVGNAIMAAFKRRSQYSSAIDHPFEARLLDSKKKYARKQRF